MHEFSVTRSLVELCDQEADRHRIARVRRINIKVGKFTGFSPDSINFYFEHLKINTRCESACLVFEEIPIRIECRACRLQHVIEEPTLLCPECGSDDIELVSGREFFVASIEGDEETEAADRSEKEQ